MRAIMISTRPQWVEKILNGIKKDEIRKGTALYKAINKLIEEQGVAPMLLYCTKGKPLVKCSNGKWYVKDKDFKYDMTFSYSAGFNGKVVARFWVDKVGSFSKEIFGTYEEPFTYNQDDLLKKSCLTEKELDTYLQGKIGYAIHIDKLEIFDKPKEISEFRVFSKIKAIETDEDFYNFTYGKPLTKAPQSWCYIEV